MKQNLISTGIAASRIAYLVTAFTTDMITVNENVELNNWLENNPENCAIFDAMTASPIHDSQILKTSKAGNFQFVF